MKIKQFFKKAAAMVMAAVTVLSLLPATAFAATGDVGTISFSHTYDSAGNAIRYNSSAVINGYTSGGTGEYKNRMYVDGSTAFCISTDLERDLHSSDLCQSTSSERMRIDPGNSWARRLHRYISRIGHHSQAIRIEVFRSDGKGNPCTSSQRGGIFLCRDWKRTWGERQMCRCPDFSYPKISPFASGTCSILIDDPNSITIKRPLFSVKTLRREAVAFWRKL